MLYLANKKRSDLKAGCFYVYVHLRTDTSLPFYVGKGAGRRALLSRGRSAHWKNIANKTDVNVVILDGIESEELAFLAEKELIDKYRVIGAPLVNLTEGGEGISGAKIKRSPESEAKRIEALRKAMAKPSVRKKMSDAQRLAFSEPERIEKQIQVRKEVSARPEYRKKLSEAAKKINADLEVKAKKSASLRLTFAKPESKAKRSEAMKAAFAKPESKAKRIAKAENRRAEKNV